MIPPMGIAVEHRSGEDRRSGLERRGVGRPRLNEREDTSQLSLRLPATSHDQLFALATEREEPVSVTLRKMVELGLLANALFRTPKF